MQCTVFLLNSAPPDSVRTVVTMNLYEAAEEHGDSPNPRQLNISFPSSRKNDAILPQKNELLQLM